MDYNELHILIRYAREYGHEKLRKLDISDTEHKICAFLYGHSGISQDDVAAALHLDRTTTSRALLSLEKKRFIERTPNPANRRKNILQLTEEGRCNIADVVEMNNKWLEEVSSCLSAEEQQLFCNFCHRLLESAKNIK